MSFIRSINALAGIALIIMGVLLARLDFVNLPQDPTSDAFLLVRFHFIMSGVTSLLVSRTAAGNNILIPLFVVLALLNIWIGGSALLRGDIAFLWIALLPIAAATNLIQVFTQDEPEEGEKSQPNLDTIGTDVSVEIPENYGEINSGSKKTLFGQLIAVVVVLPLSLFFLLAFIVYARSLMVVVFDGSNIYFSKVPDAISNFSVEVWINLGIIIVAYGGIILLQMLWSSMAFGGDLKKVEDANRPLSDQERGYIASSIGGLFEYIESKPFGRGMWFVSVVYFVFPFALILLVPMAIFLGEYISGPMLEPQRAKSLTSLVYSGPVYIGGIGAGLLLGMGAAWSIMQSVGTRIHLVGQYLHTELAWNTMESGPRTMAEHLKILVRFVRLRRLDVGAPFDPGEFLYWAFREREGIVYRTTISLAVATVLLTLADIGRFQLVHEGGVRYSKYLSLQTVDLELSEIDSVELRCFRFGSEGDEDRKFGLGYALVEEGEFSVDVLRHGEKTPEFLARLIDLDAKLRAAGIVPGPAKSPGIFWREQPGFAPNCAEQIRDEYEPEVAAALLALMALD